MNPWGLSAGDLLAFGIAIHLFADFPLQNDWMANNKAKRRERWRRRWNDHSDTQPRDRWWDRHPAAYVHAGIHGVLLAFVFGWVAIPLAVVHLIIDTRKPVVWWSQLVKQTQPKGDVVDLGYRTGFVDKRYLVVLYDIGTEVRIWTDQTFHIACVAVAALLVTL